jgi:hypothetical protein
MKIEAGEIARVKWEVADKAWLEKRKKMRALYEDPRTRAQEQERLLRGIYLEYEDEKNH